MSKNKCINIASGNFRQINGICSDKDYMYLTQSRCNIILGIKIKEKGDCRIKVPFNIRTICYDSVEDSFWGVDENKSRTLIQIDKTGKVLDDISLNPIFEHCCNCSINTIAFNGVDNTFLVSIKENSTVYVINKSGSLVNIIPDLGLAPIKDMKVCGRKIFIYSGEKIYMYDECFKKINCIDILECNSNVFLVNKIAEDSYAILVVVQSENTVALCRYLISSECNDEFNNCNSKKECSKNDDCNCGKNKSCKCKKICELIETIALQETGIAHIINAEGEKIQKAVKICKDYKCLISVNTSVSETLEKIVELEIILTNKLKRLHQMLKECNDNNHCKKNHNCRNDDCEERSYDDFDYSEYNYANDDEINDNRMS